MASNNHKEMVISRELLLEAVEHPEILEQDCKFSNNFVKNLCKGFANHFRENWKDYIKLLKQLDYRRWFKEEDEDSTEDEIWFLEENELLPPPSVKSLSPQ